METVSESNLLPFIFKSSNYLQFSKIFISRLFCVFFFPIVYQPTYDNALSRLIVRPWDNWRGINASGVGADFNPEPPIFAAKFATAENYNHILAIANEDGRVIQ